MRSTVRTTLATCTSVERDNWAELLPFVQLAHKTRAIRRSRKLLYFLTFSGWATFPVGINVAVPSNAVSDSQLKYPRRTVENSQLEHELARCNHKERSNRQVVSNENVTVPRLKPGDQVLVHQPYSEAGGPNPTAD